jgi:hypothetical protein
MRPNKKPHKLIDNIAIAKKLIITGLSHKHFYILSHHTPLSLVSNIASPYYRHTPKTFYYKEMSIVGMGVTEY